MTDADAALLRESVVLARHWADSLCRHVDDSGVSCASFHGIWQILRCLDLNTTPAHQRDFFVTGMAPAIAAGARRVLVCGAADYALPAVVLDAFAAAGATPDITVLDVCETPLRLCKWFAEKKGVVLRTVRDDALAWREEAPFDLICSHSFLGLFSSDRRRELASVWRRQMVPGGRLFGVNRLRPGAPARIGFSTEQADAFVRQVTQRLAASGLASLPEAADIATLADRYIRHRVVHAVRDEAELAASFAAAGLAIEHLAVAPPAGAAAAPAGPTLRGGARYACFVARRDD